MDRIGRPNIQEVVNQLLGQEICVSWPHLIQAMVVKFIKITLLKQGSKIPQPFALQTTRKDVLVHYPSFKLYWAAQLCSTTRPNRDGKETVYPVILVTFYPVTCILSVAF